jgi:hypothetical protein
MTPETPSGWKDAVFKGPGCFFILVALFFVGVVVVALLSRLFDIS